MISSHQARQRGHISTISEETLSSLSNSLKTSATASSPQYPYWILLICLVKPNFSTLLLKNRTKKRSTLTRGLLPQTPFRFCPHQLLRGVCYCTPPTSSFQRGRVQRAACLFTCTNSAMQSHDVDPTPVLMTLHLSFTHLGPGTQKPTPSLQAQE